MTDGEKMIWSAVFGQEYVRHDAMFRVDMRGKNHDIQRCEHRAQSAALAAEAASDAVIAARSIKTEDINGETAEMMGHVFECV